MIERVVSVEEMRQHDRYTEAMLNLEPGQLMDWAGRSIYQAFRETFAVENKRILVVSGSGHNGGDALVFASACQSDNLDFRVVVIGTPDLNNAVYQEKLSRVHPERLKIVKDLETLDSTEFEADYIIDGIFGTGLSRPVKGLQFAAIQKINAQKSTVISVDISSGINADTGEVMNEAIKSDMTFVIQYYKFGNLMYDGLDYSNETRLLDISILFKPGLPIREKYSLQDIVPVFPKRKHHTHKYHYGNILVIGGQPGMMGAPQLAAIAALQSGAGLVTLGINRKDLAYFTQFHPEIMVGFYDTFNDVEALLAKRDVVIFGPGLGKTNPLAHEILAKLIQTKIPLIVDADGLSYLKSFIDNEDFDDQIIITPHAGEMAKLMGCDRDEIEKTPWRQLDHLKNKKIVTVLKGATTIISGKDTCRFVDAGNPGMATAGSGDLLCGIIAAFLARGFVQEEAALRGVIWHCEAGRRARQKYGEDGITASRMLEMF